MEAALAEFQAAMDVSAFLSVWALTWAAVIGFLWWLWGVDR